MHCSARGLFHDGRVAAIINVTRSGRSARDGDEACLALLRPLAREFDCSAGVSEGFCDPEGIFKLGIRHEQALFALSASEQSLAAEPFGATPASPIVLFPSVAIRYFQERVVQPEAVEAFMHPALATLREYDAQNRTALYETLRTFLENDRNVTETADMLFVHRNTLLKRLKKISAIATLDLDDVDCRKRLVASYLVEWQG